MDTSWLKRLMIRELAYHLERALTGENQSSGVMAMRALSGTPAGAA